MTQLTYATRRSALALAQCRAFVGRLTAASPGLVLREEQVVTSGDRIQDRPLSEVGGKGLFVKEIEEALLTGRADFAVHSIKDVPGVLPDGLSLVCIPTREDARDVIVSPNYRVLEALPVGAKVGTSSLRRGVALLRVRPDLRIVALRGNVDTRLRKVEAGECDAIVLARAGLVRLGLEARATEVLEPEVSLPAIGQGALGIECRSDDASTIARLAALHDAQTGTCVTVERGVMIALEGDCRTPIAAYAEWLAPASASPTEGSARLRLRAFIANPDGSAFREVDVTVAWPATPEEAERLGLETGARLRGA